MTAVFLGSVILGAMLLFVAVVVLLAIASLLEILPRDRDEPVRLEVEGEVSSGSQDRPSGIAKFSSR